MIPDDNTLKAFGIASLMPGFKLMRQILDSTEAELRAKLEELQLSANGFAALASTPKRGRPSKISATILNAVQAATAAPHQLPEPKVVKSTNKRVGLTQRGRKPQTNTYWSNMTPEERSAEMLRRLAVSRGEARSIAKVKHRPSYKAKIGSLKRKAAA